MASILKAGKQVLLWSAGAGVAVPLLLPAVLAEEAKPCCCKKDNMIKPSQLPIYDEPEDLYDVTYEVDDKGQVQEGVEAIHKEITGVVEATKDFRDKVDHIWQTGRAHTAGQIDYLLDKENVAARAGVIAGGGLLGLLLGARKKGGLLKKLLFTSSGVTATTAALYPQQTRQYTDDVVNNAEVYATVAYNFCFGVKPNGNGGNGGGSVALTPSALIEMMTQSKQSPEKEPTKAEEKESSTNSKDELLLAKDDTKVTTNPVVDQGQSNPEDADMYTTRS